MAVLTHGQMDENRNSNQEIHMLFERGLNIGLNLKIHKMSYLHDVIPKVLQTNLIISPMLLFAKILHTAMMWQRYDIRKFTADSILFTEIQRKKMNVLVVFSVQIWLE